jgi:hypothetical protein
MHFLTYLGTSLSLLSVSAGLPTSLQSRDDCNALIEHSGWQISGIVVCNAEASAPVGSYIQFHVSDTNPGLEFETNCGASMPAGTGTKPEEATGGWTTCENKQLRFQYSPETIQLSRVYEDPW